MMAHPACGGWWRRVGKRFIPSAATLTSKRWLDILARRIGRATTTLGTRGGRDDATSAYLDQFARELQALRLDFKMSRGAVRIARLGAAGKARIRRGKRWGSEGAIFTPFHADGTGRGSHQAAAAALVYDDHDGDVRPRRVIVVGLALVVSLGLWQAEQRAHEPAHGGRAEPETCRGKKNRKLDGCEPRPHDSAQPSRDHSAAARCS